MIYSNETQSKFSYEVLAYSSVIDCNVGDFKTIKEAKAAIIAQDFPAGTSIEISKITWSPRTPCCDSGVIDSKIVREFDI